jgi:hypothetical protein
MIQPRLASGASDDKKNWPACFVVPDGLSTIWRTTYFPAFVAVNDGSIALPVPVYSEVAYGTELVPEPRDVPADGVIVFEPLTTSIQTAMRMPPLGTVTEAPLIALPMGMELPVSSVNEPLTLETPE